MSRLTPRRRVFRFRPKVAGPPPQNIPVTQTSTADTAQPHGRRKSVRVDPPGYPS